MAPTLGKRKRITREELERASRSPSPSSDSGAEDLQAIFRRAFEAKFKPLPAEPKKPKPEVAPAEESEEDGDSDWSGISDTENDVEVIEYKDSRHERDEHERAEMKAFMSSKPPTSAAATPKNVTIKKKPDEAELTETANLQNDLALQKLLRESHLLSAASSKSSKSILEATGIARHKSTDLHLQSLGAKASVFTQKKMPMAQRKHMVLKARLTEEKRRSEAKEAGIVLETAKKSAKVERERKREREVGGPSIGRFKGGTLSLSRKDVRSITAGGGKGKGKKGKR
ncbi:hypothetical protein EJ02DRAFT_455574 [Clathrospora elynae]|uniref:Uncharacterized protein n=1 Tax=Clathrospora elynae TaxID=706981 RepID=A0A6A5SM50_9PLEO|nr:hypothetical protein EJ02DRAFT_455574 [Clathrospora elynae]